MIAQALVALAIPTLALLAGRQALRRGWPPPSPWPTVLLAALAPAGVQAWRGRPPGEVAAGWVLGLVGWGGALVGRDPEVLVATALVGALWGAFLSLPGTAAPAPPPRPPRRQEAGGPAPAARGNSPASTDGGGGAGDPEVYLTLPCPSCGAGVTFPIYHRMARCAFCGSRHLVQRSDLTLYTVIPNAVTDEKQVAAAVLAQLRQRRYWELYERSVRPLVERRAARLGDPLAAGLPDALDRASLAAINAAEEEVHRAADAYAQQLAPHLQVLAWQPFLAPYWHRSGTLYQVAFGRREDGAKEVGFVVTHVEGSRPATSLALPDMGKLSYLRALRPLQGAPEAALPALPLEGGHEELTARLRAMEERRVAFAFRVIALRGSLVLDPEVLVWRPFHLARVRVRGQEQAYLLDGASGKVAAPGSLPLPPLQAVAAPPTDAHIRLAPSRCPVCGADLPFIPEAAAHLCGNCFRLLEVAGHQLRPRAYLREDPRPALSCLPFWRFPLQLRTAHGEVLRDLDHLGDLLDGVPNRVGDRPQGQSFLYVPAFRLRPGPGAQQLYRLLWPLLHGAPRPLQARPFDATAFPAEPWPLTLPAAEARTFGLMFLALSFSPRDLARVDAAGMRARFLQAQLEGEPEPAFLGLPREVVAPYRGLLEAAAAPAVAGLAGRRAPSTRPGGGP